MVIQTEEQKRNLLIKHFFYFVCMVAVLVFSFFGGALGYLKLIEKIYVYKNTSAPQVYQLTSSELKEIELEGRLIEKGLL